MRRSRCGRSCSRSRSGRWPRWSSRLFFDSATLESAGFVGAFSKELAKFIALVLGVVALGAIARQRGWAEIGGLMDGIVYGTAIGLGFVIGETLSRELTFGGSAVIGAAGAVATVGGIA